VNTARPPGSAFSGASAPEAAAAPVAGGLDAATAVAPAVGFETAMALADVPETAVAVASLPETTTASVDLPEAAVAVAGMPEATAAVAVQSGSAVSDFMIHRVARALRERVRYRYVAPRVLREGESFRIQSPCCSRNVDPSGGLIDIALLTPGVAGVSGAGVASGTGSTAGLWSLSARDHANSAWRVCLQGEPLDTVLDALCVDSERQFWP
jgi:hypothetical protein